MFFRKKAERSFDKSSGLWYNNVTKANGRVRKQTIAFAALSEGGKENPFRPTSSLSLTVRTDFRAAQVEHHVDQRNSVADRLGMLIEGMSMPFLFPGKRNKRHAGNFRQEVL